MSKKRNQNDYTFLSLKVESYEAAAGVSFEDREDLLGHKNARITTHYSGPELANLIAAAEKVCEDKKFPQSPAKIGLRRRMG